MKKILFSLVLLAALVAYGSKLYLEDKISQGLDDTARRISSAVKLTYRGVEVDFSGLVKVNGLFIENLQEGGFFTVDQVQVKFPDFQSLLFLNQKSQDVNDWPASLQFKALHIKRSTAALLSESEWQQQNSVFDELSYQACVRMDLPRYGELLEALEYEQLDADISMGYQRIPGTKDLQVNVAFVWDQMVAVNGDFMISDLSQASSDSLQSAASSQINFEIEDQGFNQRFLPYCMVQPTSTPQAELAEQYAQALRAKLAEAGIRVADEAYQAYVYYLANKGPINVQLAPLVAGQVPDLSHYRPEDIWSLLGMSVRYGEQVVTDLGLEIDAAKLRRAQDSLLPAVVEAAASDDVQPVETTIQYQAISLANIEPYLGKVIRVVTKEGKQFDGTLKRADEKRLWLTVKVGRGSADLPIYRNLLGVVSVPTEVDVPLP